MIGLLREVAQIVAVILPTVLSVYLESRFSEGPSGEQRGELIVGAGKLLIDARLIHFEKSLKRLPDVRSWDTHARPDRMNESRAADLEAVEPARLECGHNTTGEPNSPNL
jgi:hypothetical protein